MEIASREGNLSADTQTPRLKGGVVGLGIGLVMAAVMLEQGVSVPLRLLLFVPFFVSSVLLFQGLFNTCPGLAARGMRDVGDGPEAIANKEQRCAVKSLAARVMLLSVAVAVLATALFAFMP
jgi:hypothetical protein